MFCTQWVNVKGENCKRKDVSVAENWTVLLAFLGLHKMTAITTINKWMLACSSLQLCYLPTMLRVKVTAAAKEKKIPPLPADEHFRKLLLSSVGSSSSSLFLWHGPHVALPCPLPSTALPFKRLLGSVPPLSPQNTHTHTDMHHESKVWS